MQITYVSWKLEEGVKHVKSEDPISLQHFANSITLYCQYLYLMNKNLLSSLPLKVH